MKIPCDFEILLKFARCKLGDVTNCFKYGLHVLLGLLPVCMLMYIVDVYGHRLM